MKNAQLFITRHYDAIKLVLISICVVLLGYIILTNIEASRAQQERRSEAIAQAVRQINDKTDEQTNQLNRQLQALCFIIVTTSGEEALRQIDPPLEEQCRDLASELRSRPSRQTVSQQGATHAETTQPAANTPPVPQGTPLEDTPPPPAPEKGIIDRAVDTVNNLLGGLL